MSDSPERSPENAASAAPPEETAADTSDFKPTPVRQMASSGTDSEVPLETVEEAVLEVEGSPWSVRVLGRAGGSGASAVPLLLLGFWPGTAAEGDPRHEHMVAGRSLEALSESDLRDAFSRARPWQAASKGRKAPERRRGEPADGATRRRRT